jgi:hypothetical protein
MAAHGMPTSYPGKGKAGAASAGRLGKVTSTEQFVDLSALTLRRDVPPRSSPSPSPLDERP